MNIPHISRARDEEILSMLHLRALRGSAFVARLYGTDSGSVRAMTNRVRDADLRESGEAPECVAAHYGWPNA